MFRSEQMSLIQLIINGEASYKCIAELGELGCLQFRDLNQNVNSFEKKFVRDVRRCEEMERQVRFINATCKSANISLIDDGGELPAAPVPEEIAQLEEELHEKESEIKQVNEDYEKLKNNLRELLEIKHVIRKTQEFFDNKEVKRRDSVRNRGASGSAETSPNRITVTAGTITKARVHYFERILWRACHGKVMLNIYDIEDEFINENEDKCVFLVVYSASRLENKVKKIAEGMRAIVYPISDDVEQRKEVQLQVVEKSEDARNVINQTEAHRNQLLTDCAKKCKKMVYSNYESQRNLSCS